MSDIEDVLRRTFSAHEEDAPNPDNLAANVRAASLPGGRGRWLVPIAVSGLTAVLVVGVVTEGFGLTGSQPPPPVPAATGTPAPNPTESTVATKCGIPPFIGVRGAGVVEFDPDVDQKVTVHVGQRILLGEIDRGLCQRHVNFNGRARSELLKPVNGIGTGSDWLRAERTGTVKVVAFQPMCPPESAPECFGGISILGSITVTIVPFEPPTPVIGKCSADQITLKAESGPGTAAQLLWVTARLDSTRGCLLSGPTTVEVFDRDGITVPMPDNPLRQKVSESLRPGRPVVIIWDWLDWFCGRADPYSARLGVLGQTARVDGVTSPSCPTDIGDPPTDPRGLRFHGVMVLR